MMKKLAYVFLCIMMASLPAKATVEAEIETAKQSLLEGDEKAFMAMVKTIEQQGDHESLVELARMYRQLPLESSLAQYDQPKVYDYYRRALSMAAQNEEQQKWRVRAENELSKYLVSRKGLAAKSEIMTLLESAVRQNYASSVILLGKLNEGKDDVLAENYGAAEKLYRQGMFLGSPEAALLLARMSVVHGYTLQTGESVDSLVQLAHVLAAEQIAQGDTGEMRLLGRLYSEEELVPANYDLAYEWFSKAHEAGDKSAAVGLADIMLIKEANVYAPKKAAKILLEAARKGSFDAVSRLADMLSNQTYEEAGLTADDIYYWVRLAVRAGDPEMIEFLSKMEARAKQIPILEGQAKEGQIWAMFELYDIYVDQGEATKATAYRKQILTKPTDNMTIEQKKRVANWLKGDPSQVEKEYALLLDVVAAGDFKPVARLVEIQNEQEKLAGNDVLKALEEAAEKGDDYAKLQLAILYWEAPEPIRNQAKTRQILRKLLSEIEQYDGKMAHQLGYVFAHGVGFSPDEEKASFWYRRALKQGDVSVYVDLADLAMRQQNTAQAIQYLMQSAAYGNDDAYVRLGRYYSAGSVIPLNLHRAFYYYNKAADQGSAEAKRYLGMAYYLGLGVVQNKEKAKDYFVEASKLQNPDAIYDLSGFYFLAKDDGAKYLSLIEHAAQKKHPEALFALGKAYEVGRFVSQDIKKAKAYYAQAIIAGSGAAKRSLARLEK